MLLSSKVSFVCQKLVNPISQCDIQALDSCKVHKMINAKGAQFSLFSFLGARSRN